MLIRMSDWDKVREHFSQEEKDRLNLAINGETICPRGMTIDESKAPAECAKFRELLKVA